MLYLTVLWCHTIDLQVEHTALLLLSRVTWQSVIAASAVENRVFSYRDIIANAINHSALSWFKPESVCDTSAVALAKSSSVLQATSVPYCARCDSSTNVRAHLYVPLRQVSYAPVCERSFYIMLDKIKKMSANFQMYLISQENINIMQAYDI